jgi:hypothetical protein
VHLSKGRPSRRVMHIAGGPRPMFPSRWTCLNWRPSRCGIRAGTWEGEEFRERARPIFRFESTMAAASVDASIPNTTKTISSWCAPSTRPAWCRSVLLERAVASVPSRCCFRLSSDRAPARASRRRSICAASHWCMSGSGAPGCPDQAAGMLECDDSDSDAGHGGFPVLSPRPSRECD